MTVNTSTPARPISAARFPLVTLSLPSVGSTVRSSSTFSLAFRRPARSTVARSVASSSVNDPVMTALPPSMAVRTCGAE